MTDAIDVSPARFRIALAEQLRHLNNKARHQDFNRQLDWTEVGKEIDPDGAHLLEAIMMHNDDHLRCRVLIKTIGSMEPMEVWLDVSFEDFESLLTVEKFMTLAGRN